MCKLVSVQITYQGGKKLTTDASLRQDILLFTVKDDPNSNADSSHLNEHDSTVITLFKH